MDHTRLPVADIMIESLLPAVRAAGRAILDVRAEGFEHAKKPDESPVTEADHRAEAILFAALEKCTPAIPVVGEEQVALEGLPDNVGATFWLVDPLDGTREFIRGGPDFTVNIGLVSEGLPVFGIVGMPTEDICWAGGPGTGLRKFVDGREVLPQRRDADRPFTAVASRSHRDAETNAYLDFIGGPRTVSRGSSIKLCILAEGEADLYPRFGPTSEWDTAAGHAVLLGAGGGMVDLAGAPFGYGKPKLLNGPFVAYAAGVDIRQYIPPSC